ncbi:MAG: hypothetical protein KBT05_01700 [Bacteroidales bacterium]|nr:hypothetical protein [Candidatus Cryptobacteroides caccocaballi]
MFENLKEFMRRRAIRKCPRQVDTGLLPLKDIHTAIVILNVEDQEHNACKEDVMAFFRAHGIKSEIFFFDFRKIEKNELLLTSIQNTVLRKDLNWYGMPNQEKIALLQRECDLLISLVDTSHFANIYSALCVKAKFKIGCYQDDSKVFDMVISGSDNPRKIFAGMKEILLTIQ